MLRYLCHVSRLEPFEPSAAYSSVTSNACASPRPVPSVHPRTRWAQTPPLPSPQPPAPVTSGQYSVPANLPFGCPTEAE